MASTAPQTAAYLDILEPIITDIVAPAATDIDQNGTFPRAALVLEPGPDLPSTRIDASHGSSPAGRWLNP